MNWAWFLATAQLIGWKPADLWSATLFEFSCAITALGGRLAERESTSATTKPGAGPSVSQFLKQKAFETARRGING